MSKKKPSEGEVQALCLECPRCGASIGDWCADYRGKAKQMCEQRVATAFGATATGKPKQAEPIPEGGWLFPPV